MPLTGKTSDEIEALKDTLLGNVPADGSSIGNKSLRDNLEWDSDLYLAVRSKLIEAGLITTGKGRGGSVRRLIEELAEEVEEGAEPALGEAEHPYPSERSLYGPMLEVIRNRWVKEQPFNTYLAEDTSQGGRRADGIWARPDLTVVASTTYTYVPSRHFDVVTFEVKHHNGIDVTAVYEALAHRRSATRSYVIVYVPDDLLSQLESPVLSEISDEATRHGIGLIVAGDPADFDTWDIREDAVRETPDPARLNRFIREQLSEGTRDEIVRWFR